MDPVSRILERRERRREQWLPWLLAALVLHAGVALGIVAVSRVEPPAPTFSPSVAVRLVRPPAAAPRRRASGRPRAPEPTPAPPPTPVPRPTAPPRRAEPQPEPERGRPSEHAMPEPTPGPTPTPEPTVPARAEGAGGAASPSGALSLGGDDGTGGGPPALPEDFRFAYYVRRMLALIEAHWYRPPVPPGTRARVRFTIQRSGAVTGIALEESSGVPSFDRAALRALYAANPLPPLPPAYPRPSITVHLTFTERP